MKLHLILFIAIVFTEQVLSQPNQRQSIDFNNNWKFVLGDHPDASITNYSDQSWRVLNLPHDWAIEGEFSKDHPATFSGGALPGGIGWYRKHFTISDSNNAKFIRVDFDGIYCNSEVWINGHFLGKRPNGYISFSYDISKYTNFKGDNVMAVRVDNSKQPNSRWYSGSGIYRKVSLQILNPIHIDHWGTFVTTPKIGANSAQVSLTVNVRIPVSNLPKAEIVARILDASKHVVTTKSKEVVLTLPLTEAIMDMTVSNPRLWSDTQPYLYTIQTQILVNKKLVDSYDTPFGIRSFHFDADSGFVLNGNKVKIRGVCNHHDLGALGTAFNRRAAERQLELLKKMGCNGIRTSHNPPAPELLDLCDQMGFIVMNEAFDMWAKKKSEFDYHLDWKQWHKQDLEDFILRDRNHPSVFIWSIGNEIPEQWGGNSDSSGRVIARELVNIIKKLDHTRPVTSGNNNPDRANNIVLSGAMELLGYNYHHEQWQEFKKQHPANQLIATETVSSLQTRGHYDMPSDSIRIWPIAWDIPLTTGNADLSCSAYDNCHAPWGSSHEATLKAFEKDPAVSGMFVWTGFDYLGEPTPYVWPARSSYFGILDLAGFPKDVYYLYQSLWTSQPVLHIFPHWNWKPGQVIDVWAYYNQADEVELFLNGKTLGKKSKTGDEVKVVWRVKYQPGTLKAVSRKNGRTVLEKQTQTAGSPDKLVLKADRTNINADGEDLCFITAQVCDKNGWMVPDANPLISYQVTGAAEIAGLDSGNPISHESFKGNQHLAFNGMNLAIVKAGIKAGKVKVTATSPGLAPSFVEIDLK